METQTTLPKPITGCRMHFTGVLIILITACSVFRDKSDYRTGSRASLEADKEAKISAAAHLETVRIVAEADSADLRINAEIFPRGAFSYSAAAGFRGEAEKLILNGQRKEGRLRQESSRLIGSSRLDSQRVESQRLNSRSRSREKAWYPADLSWLYLLGCALIFALIYRFRNYLPA